MMKQENLALSDDGHCFVCGPRNTEGLKVDWFIDGKETFAEFVADKRYQGWKGVVHGGVLAALLDEAMTRLIWKIYGAAVTAEMTVRYLSPAKVGEKLKIYGKIKDDTRRVIKAEAYISREDGTFLARSDGKALAR